MKNSQSWNAGYSLLQLLFYKKLFMELKLTKMTITIFFSLFPLFIFSHNLEGNLEFIRSPA